MTIELNHDAAERALGRDYGSDERRSRPWLIGVVALAVIGTFCGIVWYAYTQGLSQGSRGGALPVLHADPSPTRERPSEPGGMKIPHQDKLIYDRVGGRDPSLAPTVERMLPPPETPIARPVAPPPSVAVTPVAPPAPAPQAAAPQAAAPAPSIHYATPSNPAPSPPAARAPAPAFAPPVTQTPAPPPRPAPPPQVAAIPPAPPPAALRPPPSAPQPAPAPITSGSYRIQLAAVRSQESAQQEWEKLKNAHSSVLGRLSSQIVRVDLGASRGVFYRIQAGPFGDADAARRSCNALKDRNVSCLVVRP